MQLSESFADLWRQLATAIEADVSLVAAGDVSVPPANTAAVILAAGGAERDAVEWLERHAVPSDVPTFVVGSDPGRRMATMTVRHGASDYFALPDDVETLRNVLAAAASRRMQLASRSQSVPPADDTTAFRPVIGESRAIKAVIQRAARLLRYPQGTALLIGETGTGKELLARAIHGGGTRRGAPFVPVNCSALPRQLVESELLGHERGAFTDANAAKPGLFEVADGGTLFLDEVGTLPVDVQAKLLRVLEDREIRRVGGTKTRRVDVRVMAATNEDLDDAIRRGTFRQDLYFRLSVITLVLPPLRERGDDAVIIARELLTTLARQHGLPVPPLTAEARQALLGHAWPGNVRELKNALERSLLLSQPGQLNTEELLPSGPVATARGSGILPFPSPLDAISTAAGRAMLEMCDGNVSEAARRLRVSRRRLRRLVSGAPGWGARGTA